MTAEKNEKSIPDGGKVTSKRARIVNWRHVWGRPGWKGCSLAVQGIRAEMELDRGSPLLVLSWLCHILIKYLFTTYLA